MVPIPACWRNHDWAPSAATTSGAVMLRPSAKLRRALPGTTAKPVISTGAMISTSGPIAPSSCSTTRPFGTRWANGSPGATSPSKWRKSGRDMSPAPESVIFICRTGSAPMAIPVHTPSSAKTRFTPAASAQERWSLGTANGRRSISAIRNPRIEWLSATAIVRPTGPPPTIATSYACMATSSDDPSVSPFAAQDNPSTRHTLLHK